MTFCYLFIKSIIIFAKTIAQNQLMNPLNTSVLLIYTGGTIGMIENAATGALENFNFEQLQKYIPELQKFNFPIDTYQFDPPMDSSDMEPDMWRKLVRIIHDNYNRYHGFVILHGRTRWLIPLPH